MVEGSGCRAGLGRRALALGARAAGTVPVVLGLLKRGVQPTADRSLGYGRRSPDNGAQGHLQRHDFAFPPRPDYFRQHEGTAPAPLLRGILFVHMCTTIYSQGSIVSKQIS